jgi:tripartite-type tricarboxylate transporter receptor subunit TctC
VAREAPSPTTKHKKTHITTVLEEVFLSLGRFEYRPRVSTSSRWLDMRYLSAILALLLALPCAAAEDSGYPSRPLKMVVPFTPGAGSDIAARFFANQLGQELGQSVLVENRPGAFGAVSVGIVKAAPADGYTLFLGGNSPIVVNPVVVKNLSYDPVKELRPVSGLTRNTNVIIVPANSDLRSLDDLVSRAKAAPGQMNAGTPASGYHLVLEWLASTAGVEFNHVPYKGGAQCYGDVAGGQLHLAVGELAGTAELIRTGKVRALATTGETRHRDLPDVPTVKETYPEFVSYSWNSLYVLAATPDAIVNKLARTMQKILNSGAARKFVQTAGTELLPLPPDEMRAFQLKEQSRFQRIATAAGIEPQ